MGVGARSQQIGGSATRIPLICLPFAGSGASFYRAWAEFDVSTLEIVALQLPGHEERFLEPLTTDVIAAAREFAAEVVRIAADRGPIALFGHSLGAVLAYETAREVLRTDPELVWHLFVSGSPGPWTRRNQRATGAEDSEFIARVSQFAGYRHDAFAEADLRELLLPVLRADVAMHEDYRPVSDEPIGIAITALRGIDDQLVSRSQAEQWRAATSGRFTMAELPGGHMYLADSSWELLEFVGRSAHERQETT
jgi:surfactin synthase thioesterase subunit